MAVIEMRYGRTRDPFVVHVGDGANTTFGILHGLGTRDVHVSVYSNQPPYNQVVPDVYLTSADIITLHFAAPPATNAYRVVVS